MDKYEYKLKLDQLKNLVEAEDYETAAEIASTINWKKVRSSRTLVMVSEIYEHTKQYDACKEVLLQAYDHSSVGRNIVSRLVDIAIQSKNTTEAEEYYQEFLETSPRDNQRYIFAYKISCLKDAPLSDRIAILEEFKEKEYTEMWVYELAALYAQADMREKCVETCDELILWFGEGEYVEKALNLKRSFQPLTSAQEEKYQKFRSRRGMVEINVPKKVEAKISENSGLPEITVTASRFNTQNLQEELAKSMQQIMSATEKETVRDSMDNIKKIVQDIPYLHAAPGEEEMAAFDRTRINEQVDEGLKSDFKEFLEESDGQISLQIPENTAHEQQVAGQMSIEDVLAEWEKTKHAAEAAIAAAEQKKLDMAKEQALSEANAIMERLQALFPLLSATPGEDIPEKPDTVGATLMPEKPDVAETEPVPEEPDVEETEPVPEEPDAAETEPVPEEPDAAGTEPVSDESMEDEAIPEEEAENFEAVSAEDKAEPVPETASVQEPASGDAGQPDGIDSVKTDLTGNQSESETESEEASRVLDAATQEMPDLEFGETVKQTPVETPKFEAPSEDEELERFLASATRMMMENSTVEVPVSGGMPTGEMPIAKQTELPDMIAPEELLDEPELQEMDAGSPGQQKKELIPEEDWQLFSYFLPVPGMKEQIEQVLEDADRYKSNSITSLRGNLLIQGEEGSGKTVLATSLIRMIQKVVGNEDAKIGKISAASLNKKDFAALVPKLAGGYLIIEKAGDLTRETAVRMSQIMERNTQGMVVVLEDDSAGIRRAMDLDFSFSKKFTGKIKIPVFTIDELVDFGKSYAKEMECAIEEMGVLALYNRINNIQRLDHPTTLSEVKDIVDQAIESAEEGGLKRLFSKKYDENDYLILREKDFE